MDKLDDLDISRIFCDRSQKPRADQSEELNKVEWKYADCLRVKLANEEEQSDTYSIKMEASTISPNSSFMSSRKSLSEYYPTFQEDQKYDRVSDKENQLDQDHFSLLKNDGRSTNPHLGSKHPPASQQSTLQRVDQNQKKPPRKEVSLSILKPNTKLHNIPEHDAEETPVNRKSIISSNRRTMTSSFAVSTETPNGSSGQNRSRISSNDKDFFNSTSRRLFQNEKPTPFESKYQQITPRVDSNRMIKTYHDVIVRKNKSKSLCNISAQESDDGPRSERQISSSILDEFNGTLNVQCTNWKVRAQFYASLLRESEYFHRVFTEKVYQQIDEETHQLKYLEYSEGTRLLETISEQCQQISSLSSRVTDLEEKCGKLSALLAMYKEQISLMSESEIRTVSAMRQIQDELSSIDLIFIFSSELEVESSSCSGQLSEQIFRVKEYVRALEEQIGSQNEKNKEKIATLSNRLTEGVIKRLADKKFTKPEDISQDLSPSFEQLSSTIEETIIAIQCYRESKTEEISLLKQTQSEHELFFNESLSTLTIQIDRLMRQQVRLQSEIFSAETANKREIHTRLAEVLSYPHSTQNIRSNNIIWRQNNTIAGLIKLLDWLEICVNVDCYGNLHIDESLPSEIDSAELGIWARKFADNLKLSFAQHVKRNFETRIAVPHKLSKQLRKHIYNNNSAAYFDQIISYIASNPAF